MALESANFISNLVTTNPTGADQQSQGDDHIRLIKSVLKNTFPNLTGAMNVTASTLNAIPGRIDTLEASHLKKDGTVAMTGDFNAGNQKIFALAAPENGADATHKTYVDTQDAAVQAAAQAALRACFPVGSIYINASVNTNPATMFGFGTWQLVGGGRALIGAGTVNDGLNASQSFTRGSTGGLLRKALTISQLPGHTHYVAANASLSGETALSGGNQIAFEAVSLPGDSDYKLQGSGIGASKGRTSATGSGSAVDLLQPYLVVNYWQRTA